MVEILSTPHGLTSMELIMVKFIKSALFVSVLGFSSISFAATPVAPQTPINGSASNINGCESLVSSATSARKTGDLITKLADAEVKCLAEKNREAIINQNAGSNRTRADAESGLIFAASIPVMNGESVDYSSNGTGNIHLVTGTAAEWKAYGTAVSSSNGMMNGIGGLNGMIDPRYANLYLLDQARAGSMMGGMPRMPGRPIPGTTFVLPTEDEIAKLKEENALLRANVRAAADDGS